MFEKEVEELLNSADALLKLPPGLRGESDEEERWLRAVDDLRFKRAEFEAMGSY